MDHYRRDERGRRRLTLRRLWVLVSHLPAESALVRATGLKPLSTTELLLAHIWQSVAGSKEPHPLLAEVIAQSKALSPKAPEHARRRAAARLRAAERLKLIDAGIIA